MASQNPQPGRRFRFWTWFGRGLAGAIIGGSLVLLVVVVLYVLLT